MKATRLHAYGDADQFKYDDAPAPVAGAGEVLVKIEASGLNPVDLYVRQGYLAKNIPLEFPAIIGLDAAGIVAGVGAGVTGFAIGDRVVAKLPIGSKGAHAEFTAMTPDRLAKLADNVSYVAGATIGLAGLTARQAVDALNVKAGERVLVAGALGAVGRAAVQYLKELDAVPVALVRAESIPEAKTLTGEVYGIGAGPAKSFDKALGMAGGPVAGAAIDMLADGGTLSAVAGVPAGANADGRIKVVDVLAEDRGAMLQEVADAAGRGELTIPVAHTLKLSQLGEAHNLLAAVRVGGKIILVP
jgi:NADPH:quinone reductase-like Zn-dependent oxidoreductase